MAAYTSDNISTKDHVTHIRQHPGMYGFIVNRQQGLFQMAKEVIDNSVDEATVTPDKHHTIDVLVIERDNRLQLVVRDQGRGIPLNDLADVFTIMYTSGKDSDGGYSHSIGTFGVGGKCTCALSETLTAVSYRSDGIAGLSTTKGRITYNEVDNHPTKDRYQDGTLVMLEPDPTLLTGIPEFSTEGSGAYGRIISMLEFLVVFNPNITFRVRRSNKLIPKKVHSLPPRLMWDALRSLPGDIVSEISNSLTPVDYLIKQNRITSPIVWRSPRLIKDTLWDKKAAVTKDLGTASPEEISETFDVQARSHGDIVMYDIEFFVTSDCDRRAGQLISSINMTQINSRTASQNEGLMTAIKDMIVQHIQSPDVRAFFLSTYKLPVHAVIKASRPNATFIGQDKNNFSDSEFRSQYISLLRKHMSSFDEEVWSSLYDELRSDIEAKCRKDVAKNLGSNAGLRNLAFTLENPKSYSECVSTDKKLIELFITEGVSAGGSIRPHLNDHFQAMFKIDGKIINPVRAKPEILRNDPIYKDLTTVLGTFRMDTELEHFNFSRICILTDADPHGQHITALLLAIIYEINPEILRRKCVCIMNPPLYEMSVGDTASMLRDKRALYDHRIRLLYEVIDIEMQFGESYYTLNESEFRHGCYIIDRIGKIFTDLARRLRLEPRELENLAKCINYFKMVDNKLVDVDTDGLVQVLGLDSCTYNPTTNVLTLSTEYYDKHIQLSGLIEDLRAYVVPELKRTHYQDITYCVTSKANDTYVHTPMDISQLYETILYNNKLYTVSHLKGLGEIPVEYVRSTCIDPLTRCQATVCSIGDYQRVVDMLGANSSKRKALMTRNVRGNR